jgi:hypothetical protein
MPAPPAEPAIPSANEVKVGSYRQDVELQTPMTLASVESFMLLHVGRYEGTVISRLEV